MKKTLLVLVATIAWGTTQISAQGQVDYESKHELGISIGAGCNSALIDELNDAELIATTAGLIKYDNSKRIGAFSMEYFYRIKPMVAIGGIFSYSNQKKDAIVLSKIEGESKMNYFTFLPAAKFDWVRRNHVGLYSKIAAGVSLRNEKDELGGAEEYNETKVFFNWQASLLGLEIGGQHLRAFAELGCGEQGIALAGVRYKF